MDSKSKILFWFLVLLTLLSISAAFYNTVVLHDFDYYESSDDESQVEDASEDADSSLDTQEYE